MVKVKVRKNWNKIKIQLFNRKPDCPICGKKITKWERATMDHIIPLSRGGPDREENLQLTHSICNRRKGDSIINYESDKKKILKKYKVMAKKKKTKQKEKKLHDRANKVFSEKLA